MKSKLLGGLFLLSVLAQPAIAADQVVIAEAPSDARWTGFYAGAYIGYHAGDLDFEDCVGLCPTDPSYESFVAGVRAGYDHQFSNNVVLGAYVGMPLYSGDDSFDLAAGAFEFNYDPKFVGFLGARLGYAMGNSLPYIHAGGNVAHVEVTAPPVAPIGEDENTHVGFHVGAGFEQMLTEHVSIDARYTFTSFGEETYDFGGGASRWSEDGHTVTMGVHYRF